MWERNIFFPLYPIARRSFLCNQRPCAAVFSFSIPSHPGPLSCLDPGNTAFNRSLVYRCTLTLHLLIASVIAFLRIRRKFVRSSVRFWKIVAWILDKPYSGCIIARRAHPRTHKHTYTTCAHAGLYDIIVDPLVVRDPGIFSAAFTENYRRERLVFSPGYDVKMNGARLFCTV